MSETLLRARCPDDDPDLSRRATAHLRELLTLPGVTVNQVMGAARVSSDTIRVLMEDRAPLPAQSHAVLGVDRVELVGPDSQDTQRHLRILVDVAGPVAVAAAAGLNRATVREALNGATVTRQTREAILAVDPGMVRPRPDRKVDATGTRRRLHALARAGWPMKVVAQRLGREGIFEPPGLRTRQVTAANRDAVVDLYDELIHSPGPSPHAARIAVSKQWAAADEWDSPVTMSDPAAWPAFPGAPVRPVSLIRAVVTPWLEGMSVNRVAEQVGVSAASVSRIVSVYGRWKVADEPWSPRTGRTGQNRRAGVTGRA